ncbi:type II toxin-antitoxin system HicB family antitoxin [Afifella sp. H1R]|uniref:type II toxin-antitoxin system HicB family antitoxin n=1 Tax=Afifella sp. H1R TaxID=2908841 RepID=UPI001F1AB90F|nr:type II toxin-antitoxin system HicB family antitoxin [Afifella sp. H1R]MCF1504314.1 type II toxin-antitoxin system HicB family antitoxin [Afifella sp. H1R]
MRVVTVSIARPEQASETAVAAFRGEAQGEVLTFAAKDLMQEILPPHRWPILQAMAGAGPVTAEHLAAILRREAAQLRNDPAVLATAGVVSAEGDRFVFPYDAVTVDLRATHDLGSVPFPVFLTPDPDGGFVARARDVAGAITQGETVDETLSEMADALAVALEGHILDGHTIPTPSAAKPDEYLVRPAFSDDPPASEHSSLGS